MTQHPYGDPAEWDGEIPAAFQNDLADALAGLGWSVVAIDDAGVEIELNEQAKAFVDATNDGFHFSAWWHQYTESWCYGIHPDEHDGHFPNPGDLLAATDPQSVAQQMDHVLRHGSPAGT